MSEGADMKFHIQTPFEKQIVGALRCCIDAHGPVTREFVGSAAKRIAAQLEALQEAQSLPELPEPSGTEASEECENCRGSGKVFGDSCFACGGYGKFGGGSLYTADQMRAYGELCRKGKP